MIIAAASDVETITTQTTKETIIVETTNEMINGTIGETTTAVTHTTTIAPQVCIAKLIGETCHKKCATITGGLNTAHVNATAQRTWVDMFRELQKLKDKKREMYTLDAHFFKNVFKN